MQTSKPVKVWTAKVKLHEFVVATRLKTEAAKLLGVKLGDISEAKGLDYRTTNDAIRAPGIVFRRLRGMGDRFKKVE